MNEDEKERMKKERERLEKAKNKALEVYEREREKLDKMKKDIEDLKEALLDELIKCETELWEFDENVKKTIEEKKRILNDIKVKDDVNSMPPPFHNNN